MADCGFPNLFCDDKGSIISYCTYYVYTYYTLYVIGHPISPRFSYLNFDRALRSSRGGGREVSLCPDSSPGPPPCWDFGVQYQFNHGAREFASCFMAHWAQHFRSSRIPRYLYNTCVGAPARRVACSRGGLSMRSSVHPGYRKNEKNCGQG